VDFVFVASSWLRFLGRSKKELLHAMQSALVIRLRPNWLESISHGENIRVV
jgi:hypothetical protein